MALEHLNQALDHIEQHLNEDVDIVALARIAAVSEHHFRRLFSALAGMSLTEYIRRRRLTRAAADVIAGDEALLTIAVRYGYGSHEAFARAFRAMHGVGPLEARQTSVTLRPQPRISFRLIVEGSSNMQYRIVEKEAFSIAGKRTRVPLVHEGYNPAIVAFVQSIDDATSERIAELSDQEPYGLLAVSVLDAETREEGTELDYYHGVVTSGAAPDDLDVLPVEAGTWVVFAHSGDFPLALQYLWRNAFTEWLPSNPYEARPGPEILRADISEQGDYADAEIWIPVVRT